MGRPWLATVDAYISCRHGSMIIANGPSRKHLKLLPLYNPSTYTKDLFWIKEDDESILPVLTIDRALYLKNQEEGNLYSKFLQNLYGNPLLLEDVVIEEDQEYTRILVKGLCSVEETQATIKIIEVELDRTLKISTCLSTEQEQQLVEVLHRNISTFTWN